MISGLGELGGPFSSTQPLWR
ncbi:rCG43693 [Rattus norvegicus]|uniref:RCG43693 n=1 Tax=Rattus norvegicus TaxID=10116 RepID=A6JJ89_RAT|nr:rCG43693 [Rattus norvegicus]